MKKKLMILLGALVAILTLGLLGGKAWQQNSNAKDKEKDLKQDVKDTQTEIDKIKNERSVVDKIKKESEADVSAAEAKVKQAKENLQKVTPKRSTSKEASDNLNAIAKKKRKSRKK